MHRIGRYELADSIGEGGAGTVFAATLHGPGNLRKSVALKLLHDGGDGLRREARLGGLLRHRHLVDVYEIGEAEGQWFCAMELCAGGGGTAVMRSGGVQTAIRPLAPHARPHTRVPSPPPA